MAKNRIDHIDIAKAIGIVLIISSHIVCTTNFSKDLLLTTYWNVLGSFYVPFFFLLSGIFTPSSDSDNLLNKPSLIKLGRGILNLIFQFFIFLILGITTYYIVKGQWLIAFKVNGPLWFLLVLIMDKVIFYFLLVRPRYQTIVAVIFIGLWGWYVGYHGHNYFYLGAAATSLPFYAMGHYMKKWLIDDKFNFYRCLSTFIIWFICFYLFFRPQNIALNMIT